MKSDDELIQILQGQIDKIRTWVIEARDLMEFIQSNDFTSGLPEVDVLVREKIKELLRQVRKPE